MDRDQFWSVDRLIPKIHSSSPFSPDRTAGGVLLSELDTNIQNKEFGEKISPSSSRIIRFYRLTTPTPPENSLLQQMKSAGISSTFVPCTLFSPSFQSLGEDQKKYFNYFVQMTERRKKIQISYPYLQLALCRCVQNSVLLKSISEDFFWLWENYCDAFPMAPKLFASTCSDLCFYLKITPPWNQLTSLLTREDFLIQPFILDPFLFDHLFREDYRPTNREINCILRHLTGFSFRKSKAYHSNRIFATTCESAIQQCFLAGLFNRKDLNESLFRIQIPSEVRTVRKLFRELPSSEVPNVDMNLFYVPLLHDENIRSRCDEILRYIENRIRYLLKMKNSLSRVHISNEHRQFIDDILKQYEVLVPETNVASSKIPSKTKDRTPIPPRVLDITTEIANEIEQDSWEITKKLTEAYTLTGEETVSVQSELDSCFDQSYETELKKLEKASVKHSGSDFWEFAAMLSEVEEAFVSLAVHQGKEASRHFALANGNFFEAMLASCNQKAMESVEDAIFDSTGEIYPEYVNEIQEVFPPLKGV